MAEHPGLKLNWLLTSTALVVSNDAPMMVKLAAKVAKVIYGDRIQICDKVNDYIEMDAAMDAIPIGDIVCTGGDFRLGATVTVKSNRHLHFVKGCIVNPWENVDCFLVQEKAKLSGAHILTSGDVYTSNCVKIDGADKIAGPGEHTVVEDLVFEGRYGAGTGTAIFLDSEHATEGYISGVRVSHIRIMGYEYGIHLKTTGAVSVNWINGNVFDDIWGEGTKYFIYSDKGVGGADIDGNHYSNIQYQTNATYSAIGINIDGKYNHLEAMIWDWSVIDDANGVVFTAASSLNYANLGISKSHVTDLGVNNTIAYRLAGEIQHIGTRNIILTAAGGWPSTTNGCAVNVKVEYGTNDVDIYHLDFDKDADEFAQWTVVLPDDYNGGTMTAIFYWTCAAGIGGANKTVEWAIQGRAYADNDAIDQAFGTKQSVNDTWLADLDVHQTAATSAMTLAGSPAAGQLCQFRVYRDVSEDDLAGDARLIAVKISYTGR